MASKYIKKFAVPPGFPEIMHDFAKEVIRYQPEDIYDFGAEYFKCLQNGQALNYQKKTKSKSNSSLPKGKVQTKFVKNGLKISKRLIPKREEQVIQIKRKQFEKEDKDNFQGDTKTRLMQKEDDKGGKSETGAKDTTNELVVYRTINEDEILENDHVSNPRDSIEDQENNEELVKKMTSKFIDEILVRKSAEINL